MPITRTPEQEIEYKKIQSKIDVILANTLSGLDLTDWEKIRDFQVPMAEVEVTEFDTITIDAAIIKYNSINWKTSKIQQKDANNQCSADSVFLRFE